MKVLVYFFSLTYIVGLVYGIHSIHADEVVGVDLAKKYYIDLFSDFQIHLSGMTDLASSIHYYILMPFVQIFGDSIISLRAFACFFAFLNLTLIYNILLTFFDQRKSQLLVLSIMSFPPLIIFSQYSLDINSTGFTFFLVGCLLISRYKNVLIGSFFFGLSISSHPIFFAPFLIVLYFYFHKTSFEKSIKLAFFPIVISLVRIIQVLFFTSNIRMGQQYLTMNKLLNIPYLLFEIIFGNKFYLKYLGDSFLPYLSLLLIIIIFFQKFDKTLLYYSLVTIFSGVILGFITPDLSFKYFFYLSLSLYVYFLLNLRKTKFSNTLFIMIIGLNLLNFSLNYFYVKHLNKGGIGRFYTHELLDSGIKDRNPYHSYYYASYDKPLENIFLKYQGIIYVDDGMLFSTLKYYFRNNHNITIRLINSHESILKDSLFITYGYRNIPSRILIAEVKLEKKYSNISELLVYQTIQ